MDAYESALEAGEEPPPIALRWFRDEMRLPWDAAKQRRFDQLMAVVGAVNGVLPKVVRQFPFNVMLWDLDRRIRTGRPVV